MTYKQPWNLDLSKNWQIDHSYCFQHLYFKSWQNISLAVTHLVPNPLNTLTLGSPLPVPLDKRSPSNNKLIPLEKQSPSNSVPINKHGPQNFGPPGQMVPYQFCPRISGPPQPVPLLSLWTKGIFVQEDQIGWRPFVLGDWIFGDHLSMRTESVGDCLSRRTNQLGTNQLGTMCIRDHMCHSHFIEY